MTDYNEGDLIEAVKGDTIIRARLTHVPDNVRPMVVLTVAIRSDVLHLEANGFAVTVLERALPTKDGFYLDREGSVWHLKHGGWNLLTSSRAELDDSKRGCFKPADYTPFTRLVPEVTA